MATVLTIAGVTQTSFVRWGSMSCKLNTLDLVLVDPATIPALGDAVTLTNPTWAGTVTSVTSSDSVDRANGVPLYKITATNTDTAGASAAPFGLSDAPNGSTTFGYRGLSVSRTQNSDGTTTVHGQCVIEQAGLWPAMTFLLTSSNQGYAGANFSVSNVTVTWPNAATPQFAIEFGDPIVTMSVWVNSSAAGVLPITTTKITDEAVTTPKIAAGAITADLLAATLILATLIKSSASGRRWEADTDGIRLYDASEGLLLNAPTDGSPVFIAGQLQASSLVSTGTAELQGANSLSTASVTTAQAGVQAPSAAPSLVKGWPAGPTLAKPSLTSFDIHGGYYDAAGGASGATACFVALVQDHDNALWKVYEWKLSDGSIDRITTLTGSTVTYGSGFGKLLTDITRVGSSWYIVGGDVTGARVTTNGGYRTITRATGAQSYPVSGGPASWIGDCISTDGTSLLTPNTGGGTKRVATSATADWSTGAGPTETTLTGLPGGFAIGGHILYGALNADGNRWWIADDGTKRIYEFTTAGALVANKDFPYAPASPSADHAFWWDGTNAFHANYTASAAPTTYKYTSWDWTTASAIYWVGYAWYDDAGTTHETVIGPRQSITMDRRMQLTVGNAAIPVGGADDPDKVRIYMLPNASAPSPGSFKLQATDALTTRILTTYNSGGAADGGGTAFPGGTGALVGSAGTGWLFRGNGSMALGGASFPTGPGTDDDYFRTDLGLWFRYDGTRWLSELLTLSIPPNNTSANGIAATTTAANRVTVPLISGGSDIYIVDHLVEFFVNGGTALGASHKWVGTFDKVDTSNAATTLVTDTIASGSSSVWREQLDPINALLTRATYFVLQSSWTKTGTPGNLLVYETITYRIVAT